MSAPSAAKLDPEDVVTASEAVTVDATPENPGVDDSGYLIVRHNLLRESAYFTLGTVLLVINLATNFTMYRQVVATQSDVDAISEPTAAAVASALLSYDAVLASVNGDTSKVCDVKFFVENGKTGLLSAFDLTRKLSLLCFVVAIFAITYFIAIKLVTLLRIIDEKHQTDADYHMTEGEKEKIKKRQSRQQRHAFKREDLGMLPSYDQRPGAAARRRERLALRLETTAFFMVQMLEETPLLMIIAMWWNLVRGLRGAACYQGYAAGVALLQGNEEQFEEFWKNKVVLFALAITVGALTFHIIELGHRWGRHARRRNPPLTCFQWFASVTGGVLVFFAASAGPLLMLYTFWICPNQWDSTPTLFKIGAYGLTGIFGGGFWVFLAYIGNEPGEQLCVGAAWCETGTIWAECTTPCCGEMLGECEALESGVCSMCCPCCM